MFTDRLSSYATFIFGGWGVFLILFYNDFLSGMGFLLDRFGTDLTSYLFILEDYFGYWFYPITERSEIKDFGDFCFILVPILGF